MLITLTGIVLIVIGIIIIWLCIKVPKFKKVGKYLGIVFLSVGFAWMAFVFEVDLHGWHLYSRSLDCSV